jgi:Domain of unknown function (DUF4382)
MIRRKALSFAFLFAALSVGSCSGPKTTCTTNCPTGNATVSFTLVADTLPANPSIISFKVSVTTVKLTPTTGTAQTLTPAKPVIDLMRLQSDTAFLGSLANVPSGTYTVEVSLSSPEIAFFNDTSSAITAGSTNCTINAVCTATLTATGSPTIASFTVTVAANANQGIELDFNLANAISLSNGTLTVNFTPSAPSPGILTAFTLPRTNANLGSGQLELIEDFTGVVSLNGSAVTLTSPTRGTLTATAGSGTNFDPDPTGTHCPRTTTALSACVSPGQVASMDVVLNSDSTFSVQEIEPLLATQQDLVEGIVSRINTQAQFVIVVTDKMPAATGSLIGGLTTGDLLTVNLPSSPPLNPFFVDTKGFDLVVPASALNLFRGQTDTTAIHFGQAVAIHVTAFTAASGTTNASVTVDTVTLRWSRLIASLTGAAQSTQINVNTVPSYFGLTSSSVFPTQVFTGTVGGDGVTNLDGIPTNAANVKQPGVVALRVLYLENTANSAPFPFQAAKIRQH